MTPPPVTSLEVKYPDFVRPPPRQLPTPHYLEAAYWWAYVRPGAVRFFDRDWLINAILWGNYGLLRDAALEEMGASVSGSTLQIACAYGNLTPMLRERLKPDARLDVVDILAVQLQNVRRKMPPDPRVTLLQCDSASLSCADQTYDQVLLYFLLHEQPDAVRLATIAEAMRVVKPGGRVIIVDYHKPQPRHPLTWVMRGVFRYLEPFAMALWEHEIVDFLPANVKPASVTQETYFGGLYQKLVIVR